METKLMAARTAVSAGIECILTHGAKPEKVVHERSLLFVEQFYATGLT